MIAYDGPVEKKPYLCLPSDPCGNCDLCADDIDENDVTCGGVFVNWSDFFERDRTTEEWALDQVLAKGRGHSVWAKGKTGKSELLLNLLVRDVVLNPDRTEVVVYMDYEMGDADLYERIAEDFDIGPDADLSRLRYAQLPRLEPLDTAEGALKLAQLLDRVQGLYPDAHLIVVIDTITRATQGPENENDTIRNFYRHTGTVLRRREATWVRLDHGGHEGNHARGGSAKRDDVDIVWKLERTDGGARLVRQATRMSWVPETTNFVRITDPNIRYTTVANSWPAGTAETARNIDDLGLPIDVSRRAASAALKTANKGVRTTVVAAALRFRRSPQRVVELVGNHSGNRPETGTGNRDGNHDTHDPLTSRNHNGNHAEPDEVGVGNQCPSPKEGPLVPPAPTLEARRDEAYDGDERW